MPRSACKQRKEGQLSPAIPLAKRVYSIQLGQKMRGSCNEFVGSAML